MLEELQQRKQALKQAASTPRARHHRDRGDDVPEHPHRRPHPGGVRVWFARLQMPVLRVAVSEPDFFATSTTRRAG
jgi:hypothetical protein